MKPNQRVGFQNAIRCYVGHAPVSLAIRELNRGFALEQLQGSVLDVGCGDGYWWSLFGNQNEISGIDISWREVNQAKQNGIDARVHDISSSAPVFKNKFDTVIGNCSLEHVREIVPALQNIHELVNLKGKFIIFVPHPDWAYQGYFQRFLLKYSPRVAMMISGAMNGFFQHWHLYQESAWVALLQNASFRVIEVKGLGSPRAEFLFRLFLPTAFIGFVFKKVFGFYPNVVLKYLPNTVLKPWVSMIEWALVNPILKSTDSGVYEYMIVAERAEDVTKE